MLFIISLASAADAELGLGLGSLPATDEAGRVLGFYDQNMMAELYGAVPVHPNVAIAAAIAHGSVSQEILAADSVFSDGFDTRTWSTTARVGVKGSFEAARWFAPYATLQGVVLNQALRLDDDPSEDDNSTQTTAVGFTGGVAGAVGSTVRIGIAGAPHLGLSAEVGWTWLAPNQIGDVATVRFDGVTGRIGASYIF